MKVASEFDEPRYFHEMYTGLHTLQVCNSLSDAHYADNTRKRTTKCTDETIFRVFWRALDGSVITACVLEICINQLLPTML